MSTALTKGAICPCPVTFVTDVRDGEPDILSGYEFEDLVFVDYGGREVFRVGPDGCWTHGQLEQLRVPARFEDECLDAFLGEQWVGSTEV